MDVIVPGPVQKRIAQLPDGIRNRILQQIASLRDHCFSGKKLQGELHGYYAIRVWPLRIIYRIRKREGLVVILRVEDRKDAYR